MPDESQQDNSIDRKIVAETPPEPSGADDTANLEAAAIAQKRLNDTRREDRMQSHLHNVSACIVWGFGSAVLIMGAAWLYHLIMPETWYFLSQEQRKDLSTSLVSAVSSSIVTDRARKILK